MIPFKFNILKCLFEDCGCLDKISTVRQNSHLGSYPFNSFILSSGDLEVNRFIRRHMKR